MISNNARVARALYLLKLDLDNFVSREFTNHHEDQAVTVLNQILGQSRDSQKPFHNMKTQDLLTVVQASWWNVFDRALGGVEPSLVREVALTHESWAGRNIFGPENAFQALSSIQRLLAAMSSPSTLELDMLKRECLESEIEAEESEEDEVPVSDDQPAEAAATSAEEAPIAEVQPSTADDTAEVVAEAGEKETVATGDEPYMADLLRALRGAGAIREEDLLARAARDGVQAQYADESFVQELSPLLVQALGEHGIHTLYGYQGEALSHILAGSNVVLEAGWAGDETVTLAISLAESLVRSPGCQGLVLCPDEESVGLLAEGLSALLPATLVRVIAAIEGFPGPISESGEPVIPTVLVASVDSLNGALGGQREEWQSLLKNLKVIGMHRVQEYQGYFGSNVAVLLRRLAHRLAVLGANPQYFLLAQGCANGIELAQNLTGQGFQAVSGLGRPSARRNYVAVSPRDPEGPGQVDLPDRIARAALACLESGRSVLVCCSGESLAQMSFAAAVELREDSDIGEEAFSLAGEYPVVAPAPDGGEGSDGLAARAVFASVPQDSVTPPGNFDGVIVAGSIPAPRVALQLLGRTGAVEGSEAFALFYTPSDTEGRFIVSNFEAFLGKEPDQVAVDPDIPGVISSHIPALVHEAEGRIYSFSREALGNAVFQVLRREARSPAASDEADTLAVDLRPAGQLPYGLWFEGRQLSTLSPYGRFREVYPGCVIVLDGRKYRVASIDPGVGEGRPPSVVLESAEALANLRTVPSFSTSVTVQGESLCLSLAPGVSLHLGSLAVEEDLVTVSVIDESGSPDPDEETPQGQGNQELVTATLTPDEEHKWSMNSQAFWIDVAGLAEGDASGADSGGDAIEAPVVAALEQMFRLGASFTFPVGKYDLVTYSDGPAIFLAEVSPESLGIVKNIFDHWRDILMLGAGLARQCQCAAGCVFCLLPYSPCEYPVDKAGGLALADRLLEITLGS